MVRGGARINAGAKPKWKNGKTKLIRVPESLIPQILEYARKLDDKTAIEIVSQSISVPGNPGTENPDSYYTLNLSNLSIHRFNGRSFVSIEDLIKLGYEIKPSKLANIVLNEIYKSQLAGSNSSYGTKKNSYTKTT